MATPIIAAYGPVLVLARGIERPLGDLLAPVEQPAAT
jgi:hypothetical protein